MPATSGRGRVAPDRRVAPAIVQVAAKAGQDVVGG